MSHIRCKLCKRDLLGVGMNKGIFSKERVSQMDRGMLKRVLGVSDLFAVGYGDLGSSIYYALGITVLFALGAAPIALGLAGLVFVCTALTYAELTSMIHESGGSASFARYAFNDLISFIAGWGLLLDYIVTIAISAFAVSPYLGVFHNSLKLTEIQIGFTVCLILLLFFLNLFGIKQSTRVSLILTLFVIVTQGVIIMVGLGGVDFPTLLDRMRINVASAIWSPSWADFWKGVAMAMVAYTGIESIAQLGAESKRPAKTVPRAIIWAMAVLLFMYFGISIVALSNVSIEKLTTVYLMDPIAGIAAALPFGAGWFAPWVGVLAACLLAVAANAGLVGASRLAFNMGSYYQLPRVFYKLHPRFRTPYWALGVFALFAILVVIWSGGKMTFLADLYNFGAMIAFFSSHMSCIVLRIKKPHLERPFKIGLNIKIKGHEIPISAIVGALATISVWILVVMTKPQGRLLGFTWIGLGIAMYFGYRHLSKLTKTGVLEIQKIKVPEYKAMHVKNILVPTRGGVQTETVQMACELAKLHGAMVTAVHVIELPFSMPLDSEVQGRVAIAEAILKRAEAVAREIGVPLTLKIVRSRSISESIFELIEHEKYDMLVLGTMKASSEAERKGMGAVTEQIIRHAKCRVWVCCSDLDGKKAKRTRLLS